MKIDFSEYKFIWTEQEYILIMKIYLFKYEFMLIE